jgi:hypothetical protein
MISRVQGDCVLNLGNVAVNISDRFCEEDGYGVIINGRMPGLDDIGLRSEAMVQYSMRENEEWRVA